jgi:predicted HicB family RNase H-like nuclease
MSTTMEYKNYLGSVEFSEADGVFYGKVLGIRALVSYEGTNARELVEDFHGAVDDYLALCRETGMEPERAYKGSFNVRVSPELHRQAVIYAAEHRITLNKFIERAMENTLQAHG